MSRVFSPHANYAICSEHTAREHESLESGLLGRPIQPSNCKALICKNGATHTEKRNNFPAIWKRTNPGAIFSSLDRLLPLAYGLFIFFPFPQFTFQTEKTKEWTTRAYIPFARGKEIGFIFSLSHIRWIVSSSLCNIFFHSFESRSINIKLEREIGKKWTTAWLKTNDLTQRKISLKKV